MKVAILETRLLGVAYERGELKNKTVMKGHLEIIDTRENAYNRIIKLARFRSPAYNYTKELYEVHILWLNGDKMCLAGFERVERADKVTDYAQSWICRIGDQQQEADNADMMPRRENWRH
jgi:hypothetical protein